MDRGSSTVEFALLVPLIVLLLALLVEVSLVARLQIEVVGAAREGARVAATTPDPAAAVAAATSALGGRGGEARVAVHRPHVVGAAAEVRVSVPYQVHVPMFNHVIIPLSAAAAMAVER